jgi:hypothetical protein
MKASSTTSCPAADSADATASPETEDTPSDPDVPSRLSVTWIPPASYATSSSIDLSSLLGSDLDVEAVIQHVTARHARETVERLAEIVVVQGGEGENGARVVYLSKQKVGEGDVMDVDERDEVPYIHIPLVGPHAVSAHIVPTTGRFEFRLASASSTAGGDNGGMEEGEGSVAREQRLRLATERIERERYGVAQPGQPAQQPATSGSEEGWMRAVVDVVARIRASVRFSFCCASRGRD